VKPLRWTTNKEQSNYMRMRVKQNRERSASNPNENWMAEILSLTPYKWKRQVQWGFRVFDFWCHELGIAIEVDGPEHDAEYDHYRDEYNFRRSGIVVFRVKNGDDIRAQETIGTLPLFGNWPDRRALLGLSAHTKKARRRLAALPPSLSLLDQYVEKILGQQPLPPILMP
jgi:very-short-patch-repair endonuclease